MLWLSNLKYLRVAEVNGESNEKRIFDLVIKPRVLFILNGNWGKQGTSLFLKPESLYFCSRHIEMRFVW